MNLLACSAYWNSLPRSTPHSWWSETWSVFLPNCSKGCTVRKAQNQTHMSVVTYPGATRNYLQTYSRHTYISSSNETDWSFPCFLLSHVVAHQASTQMHDPCKSEEGSVRKLVHFTQPLERIWVQNSFKPLNRTWWRLLISMSQIWQLKIFSFFFY